jgi:hypothetical protein
MFSADADKSVNLLRIRVWDRVTAEEVQRCVQELRSLLPGLRKGFTLLTDLSGLAAMDLDCVPPLEGIMDLCRQAGVAMVVRVIPDPHKDIGFNILSVFHYPRRVKIVTCETMEEAQSALRPS